MANEPVITIVGNLTADPEMRFTSGGVAVASFTVASTPRKRNAQTDQWEDGEPMFVRCSAWRDYAENVAESLSKGTRVLVTGRLTVNRYQTQNGEQREGLELQVDEIGPSLRYAKAQVTKTSGGGNYNRGNQGGYGQNPGAQGAPSGQGGQGSYGGQASYNAPQGGSAYDPWSQQPQAPQGGSAFDDMPPF